MANVVEIHTRRVGVNYDTLTDIEKQNVVDIAVNEINSGKGDISDNYGINIDPNSTVDIALVGHKDELMDMAAVMDIASRVIANETPLMDNDSDFSKGIMQVAMAIRTKCNQSIDKPQVNPPTSPINPSNKRL